MTDRTIDRPIDGEWLRRMAEIEDVCGSVSVGGLAHELGMLRALQDAQNVTRAAFAKLIELARRRAGIGIEDLATKAHIGVGDLVLLERGSIDMPEARSVFQLCTVLSLPPGGVMQLAGLAQTRDQTVDQAAVRFAARSKGIEKLTSEERNALQDFVKVLAEAAAPK